MSIYEKLAKVQNKLKAPKSQYNKFGNYNYRNCEDILEAVKPICQENNALVYLSDELVLIGERYYIKALATFVDIETGEDIKVTAFAREEKDKKGMDGSQITGASSSYARKYALNGLFDIDDTKDSDATNNGDNSQSNTPAPQSNDDFIMDADVKLLVKALREKGWTQKSVCEKYGCASLRGLRMTQYEEIMGAINGN